jgi:hypothetical protein
MSRDIVQVSRDIVHAVLNSDITSTAGGAEGKATRSLSRGHQQPEQRAKFRETGRPLTSSSSVVGPSLWLLASRPPLYRSRHQ